MASLDAARRVDAVVVDYHAGDDLARCVASLADDVGLVVVVDNATPPTARVSLGDLAARVTVVEPGVNVGFGAGVNRGASVGSAPYVLVANPDLVAHEDAVERMATALDVHPAWAIVGPTILQPDGSTYPSVRRFPSPALAAAHALCSPLWPSNPFTARYRSPRVADPAYGVDWVSGACFLVRRSAFEALGGFDEGYFMFAEDLDLCFRAHELGFGIGAVPEAVVTHVEGVSRARTPYRMVVEHHRSALRFQLRSARGIRRLLLPAAAVVLGLRLVVALGIEWSRSR